MAANASFSFEFKEVTTRRKVERSAQVSIASFSFLVSFQVRLPCIMWSLSTLRRGPHSQRSEDRCCSYLDHMEHLWTVFHSENNVLC